jgi:hypothetical protein
MRLRPDEPSVDQPDLTQSLQLPQANRKQLARLEGADGPGLRRREEAVATFAEGEGGLFRNAFGNVDAVAGGRG